MFLILSETKLYFFIVVDSSKQMLGTFSPQTEPYIHVLTEETTPSGMFARGSYSAKSKVVIVLNFLTLAKLVWIKTWWFGLG